MTNLTTPKAKAKPLPAGTAREQLETLYRAIGIPAVAAAAAQMAREQPKPVPPKHTLPACLRDEDDGMAA